MFLEVKEKQRQVWWEFGERGVGTMSGAHVWGGDGPQSGMNGGPESQKKKWSAQEKLKKTWFENHAFKRKKENGSEHILVFS